MVYTVVYSPQSLEQIKGIYRYIAKESSSRVTAKRYTDAIMDYCDGMERSPKRGVKRDDIRPGLRITNYKGSTVLAFFVDDSCMEVGIVGIYYGGQDYEAKLQA